MRLKSLSIGFALTTRFFSGLAARLGRGGIGLTTRFFSGCIGRGLTERLCGRCVGSLTARLSFRGLAMRLKLCSLRSGLATRLFSGCIGGALALGRSIVDDRRWDHSRSAARKSRILASQSRTSTETAAARSTTLLLVFRLSIARAR